KSTARPRAPSNAKPAPPRPTGESTGESFVQSIPFQVHVSVNSRGQVLVQLSPPKRSATPRAVSCTSEWPLRAAGTVAGERRVQPVPSHSHVSSRYPEVP